MRRKFLFGLGLAGLVSAPASAQFASERTGTSPATTPGAANPGAQNTPPPLPPGVRPIGATPPGGAYVPPVAGIGTLPGTVTPAVGSVPPAPPPPRDLEIRSALGANHPWAIKPEHGEYFLCVKSYSRPSQPEPGDKGLSARELAETLATDIRDLYRVQAFLYEYVSEERKAEMAAIAAARERARIFASQLEKYRQEAQLKGMGFLDDEAVRVRYKTVRYNDQIAVLVGGFKTEEDARKALETMRKWPPPKNTLLMDIAQIPQVGKDGKREVVGVPMNPYLTANVVSNPAIAKSGPKEMAGLDPFVKKLNEDNPYNLLKATKGWTLAVKSFSSPVEIQGQDGGNVGLMRKTNGSRGAKVLEASGDQAEKMASALRQLKGKGGEPLGLEAFVLHTRTASIVTIGQFDGPNDPSLLQTKQLLTSLPLKVTEDQTGLRPVANAPTLFGNMVPIPVPKE